MWWREECQLAGRSIYCVSKGQNLVIPEKGVNLREERDEHTRRGVAWSTGRGVSSDCVVEGGVMLSDGGGRRNPLWWREE